MYKTWTFDEEKSEFDNIHEIIKEYNFTTYLMSFEEYNSKGVYKPHYHILVEITDNNLKPYNNFIKKIKFHYKLIEKHKEIRKQKGRKGYTCFAVREAECYTPEKYKRYIAKDGLIVGNIPQEELHKIIEDSRKVKEKKEWKKKVLEYVEEHHPKRINVKGEEMNTHDELLIKSLILDCYRKSEAPWCESSIKTCYNFVITYSVKPWIKLDSKNIIQRLNILSQYAKQENIYHSY